MFRRVIFVFITIPVAIALIALAVANRTPVPLSFDVFNPGNPALTVAAPLFVWIFGGMLIGVLFGGIATWLSQGKHRKRERAFKRERDKLRYEINDQAQAADQNKSLVLTRA